MNKKIIAAAIAATFAAPAMASDVTVYGKVRQSVDFVDMGAGSANSDNIQINDQASRLGVKGSEDLGNGLKGVFKMEFDVKISENTAGAEFGGSSLLAKSSPSDGAFKGRNAYVGVAGDFGTLLVGRHDHPVKMSTGSLDYFADTQGDYNRGYAGQIVDLRADGVVAYVTPDFGGFTGVAALVPGENNNADGIADAYSLAGMYKNAGFFVSVAYEEGDKDMDSLFTVTGTAPTTTVLAFDYEQTRVGLGYSMDAFAVNVVWADTSADLSVDGVATPSGNIESETYVISGKYTMGNNVIKAKWFDTDNGSSTTDVDGFAIGLEHNFSKRTQAQLVYVSADQNHTDATNDGDIFSVQLNHNF